MCGASGAGILARPTIDVSHGYYGCLMCCLTPLVYAFSFRLTMLICFAMLFFKLPRWLFKTLSGLYFFCLICQILTFPFVDNDVCNGTLDERFKANATSTRELDGETREEKLTELGITAASLDALSTDASLAIVASLFFLVLGVMILLCPTPDKSVGQAVCGNCYCLSSKETSRFNTSHSQSVPKQQTLMELQRSPKRELIMMVPRVSSSRRRMGLLLEVSYVLCF